MVGSPRHGWAVFAAMSVLWFAGVPPATGRSRRPSPLLHGMSQQASDLQAGGNMEGKEVRFGIANSALFATVTTDASCGAVNGMHDSFTPLGGMVPLVNILLGEVVFGGVGAGMYGMLIFVVMAVFIAGLMVGRTPEYLGKKIEAYDVQMACSTCSSFRWSSSASPRSPCSAQPRPVEPRQPRPARLQRDPLRLHLRHGQQRFRLRRPQREHALVQLLAGHRHVLRPLLMLIPMLAIAGNLAAKKSVPATAGTFPVTTPLFTALLTGVIVIVGALTFFPVLALGPVLEHLLMHAGQTLLADTEISCHPQTTKPALPLRSADHAAGQRRCTRQAQARAP